MSFDEVWTLLEESVGSDGGTAESLDEGCTLVRAGRSVGGGVGGGAVVGAVVVGGSVSAITGNFGHSWNGSVSSLDLWRCASCAGSTS